MAHYIVAQIDITDRKRYAEYEAGFIEIFIRYEGKALAVDEAPTVLEGEWACTRTVVIEFPSKDEALRWYQSDDYQELAQHRHAASSANIAILAGLG